MTEYADSVEPFVGPTVGGPSSPDTAYSDFKAGVVKAQQDSEAQLARRSETPFGQFLDMLGTGMMALPAGPLRTPRGSAVPAPPRPPAATDHAAGELHEVLASPRVAAESDIRPPNENLRDVVDSNFNHGRVVGDETVPIGELKGGTRASSPSERARIKSLADDMRGEGGYIERLIVDDAGNVVEGQHRLDALRELGAKQVPVVRVKDLERGVDTKAMGEAIRKAGPVPSDHVHQITRNALEMLDEAGGAEAALRDYDLPASHRAYYEAALRSATNVVPLKREQTYTPYEIPKAAHDPFEPPANRNVEGERLTWNAYPGGAGPAKPNFWWIRNGDNETLASVTATSSEGKPVYLSRVLKEHGWERSPEFKTSDAAKKWAEGHIQGDPESANVLLAREAIKSIEGGLRESSRFEHPAAETMPGAGGATTLHEILGDQPLSRQGLAKSDAPLEARTSALIEGIDRAIEQGKKIRASVNSYVGSAYKTLNAIHRRGTPDQLDKVGFSKHSIGGQEGDVKYREISDHLDQAISKTRLPDDALLYRGVGQTLADELAGLKPGQTITDKAFMSTSRREQVANGFAAGSGILRTLIEIKAPKGMPALDMGLLSKRNVEQEVVLPRNTELRYIGRTSRFNKNLTPVYQFEVVPSWESESSPKTTDLSTRTARGSSSSTPTGDLPTSSVRRPRPSYRPSPPSESSPRSKFGDARESLMFYPPERAPRPFQEDFPSGARHEGSGIITRDPEGRPLTAPFVAGRNVVGGPNQAIPEARYDTITARLLGKAAENVPPGKNPGSVGVTNFNTETRLPHSIELNNNLSQKVRPLVYGHEIGHVIDQFAGEIPITGIEKELYRLFNSLNNPIRTRGGNDAHPWSPRMTPRKQGYAKDEAPRELMAEAARAYMQNPNYIKAEAPNVAARIRAYVNEHPWIKQTIQFNSLAGLGIIATEHDEQ